MPSLSFEPGYAPLLLPSLSAEKRRNWVRKKKRMFVCRKLYLQEIGISTECRISRKLVGSGLILEKHIGFLQFVPTWYDLCSNCDFKPLKKSLRIKSNSKNIQYNQYNNFTVIDRHKFNNFLINWDISVGKNWITIFHSFWIFGIFTFLTHGSFAASKILSASEFFVKTEICCKCNSDGHLV